MNRKSIPANVQRRLWAECGGYCQNPACNNYLFAHLDGNEVSLANMAHVIGSSDSGPRSNHPDSDLISRDSFDNLLMLCLSCHKLVDELEQRYSVDELRSWKKSHAKRIASLFETPTITDERSLLILVNDLIDENRRVFEECGPYSQLAYTGSSGDSKRDWQRRCLSTILPNNQRIVDLITRNRSHFGYPWDVYRQMLDFKIHADSFRENCLFFDRIGDYKLYPRQFDKFVKERLGIIASDTDKRAQEEVEYRAHEVERLIQRFFSDHSAITKIDQWNKAIFAVTLRDGRSLRVFVTNTYYFTSYSLDQVLSIDPAVDAIICASPYSRYSDDAKQQSIDRSVGLFDLREFMGAISVEESRFLNFLVSSERSDRIRSFKGRISELEFDEGISLFCLVLI